MATTLTITYEVSAGNIKLTQPNKEGSRSSSMPVGSAVADLQNRDPIAHTILTDFRKLGVATITGATAANPVVVTAVAHGFQNETVVVINDVSGMTNINRGIFRIANVTADTFELRSNAATPVDTDGSGFGAYTSGGTATVMSINGDFTITMP